MSDRRPEVHGTRLQYKRGCRCAQCRRANAVYHQQLYVAKAKGRRLRGRTVIAWPTQRRLLILLKEGFTRGEIAQRLGLKRPRLEWDHDRVTVATEERLRGFYDEITAEGPELPDVNVP